MLSRTLIFATAMFLAGALQAQSTLDTIGVTALRALDPTLTGTGVRVAQPEAVASGTNGWEVNPSMTGTTASFFTYQSSSHNATSSFPNAAGTESDHARQVGEAFYGKVNTSSPEGVAYGVSHVDNYNATYFYNSLIALNQTISGKVVNQSFIFNGQDPIIDQAYDNYVALYNTIFCNGVGNGGTTSSSSTCYNGLGVAAWGTLGSSHGPTTDGRSKPDITAPAGATSFSTPLVSGAAAILVEAGNRLSPPVAGYATDSRTVKALLLNGAIKQPLLQSGTTSRPGWTHTTTAPLDIYQGAGVLNVFNSYQQLAAGRHTITTSNASQTPPSVSGTFSTMSGWDYATLTSGTTNHYFFDLNPAQGSSFTVTSTLVWNRQNNQTSINNLDLYLYNAAGTLKASSVSTVDNVEHLFTSYLAPGRYDLEVVKNGAGSVTSSETYALAFNFTTNAVLTATISTSGSNAAIQFPSIAGHTYRVEHSPDLVSWSTLSDNIGGTGSAILTTDSNALIQTRHFYRVKVLQ